MPIDTTIFPHPVYKNTVLKPLFNSAIAHYVEPVSAINRAHLVMLVETGVLQAEHGNSIAKALRDIDQSLDLSSLEYTGEHEDYFFLVEAELRQRLGPDIAGMLHTARSRNDMDHTVFKMILKQHANKILSSAHQLATTLHAKATAERDTLIVAYTHGQPAQPTTFGHYLCAALEVLLRDIERVHTARLTLDYCPMGAAAITTSGFAINRNRMAELLGFNKPLLNSYGCIASVDYITGWYSALKLIFLHLGRVAQDMQFWSAFEVGQLHIPDSLVQISSIMPQKRNPVPIEHLRHLSSITCGRCDAIVNTMHNTPFTDMNDSEGEVQQAGYAVYDSGNRALDLYTAVFQACSIDDARVSRNSNTACITVTELADSLVRVESLSFRQAHEIAAETAIAVIASGQPLGEGYIEFTQAFFNATGRTTQVSKTVFADSVSARSFVSVRNQPGGPAPEALDSALTIYASQLMGLQQQLESYQQQQKKADDTLASTFHALIEGKQWPT